MTITQQAVNELIQSLESAGELSIKERKYLDVMRWAIRVAGERDAALNAERVWEKTMMEACGEDGPASAANEIRSLRALRDTALTELRAQVEQLAAENVALKAFGDKLNDMHNALNGEGTGIQGRAEVACQQVALEAAMEEFDAIETPATDRIVAGIKADGRIEGINFAAGRLAAAFNHGFVDKSMAEVYDVVRMILTAKEDLANNPAEDGLSGEYAEKSLAEWEAALREGAEK